MSYILQGAPYNSNENEYDNIEIKKQQRKNKTLKQPVNKDRPINNGRLNVSSERQLSSNAKSMIGSIHNLSGGEADSNALADFYPPPHGELQNRKAQLETNERDNEEELKPIKNYHVTSIDEGEETDGPVNIETFKGIEATNGYGGPNGPHGYSNANTNGLTYTGQNNYVGPYTQKIPYYSQMSKSSEHKDHLLEKLNYMIHLLEEQQDEKTGHVVEELILYSFLGVFLIFIVDSFARAGKYTR
jgi:hypothetical protein